MKLFPCKQDGLYGFADKEGNIVLPCQWRDARGFHCGRAWVRNQEGLYGFIDETGNVVVPCQWKRVYSFTEELAAVQDAQGLWGYIDKSGKLVIPCKWKSARSFTRGRAAVENEQGVFLHIDKQGNLLLSPFSQFTKWLRRLFTLSIFLLFALPNFAQVQQYTARVLDANSGEPLPFAKAFIAANLGTVTNYEGDFSIEALPTDTLKISFIGYASQRFAVHDLPATIRLKPLTRQMKEVTVRPIQPLLVEASRKLYAEYKRFRKVPSTYFLRLRDDFFLDSATWAGHKSQMVESFIKGRGAVNLRSPVAITGYRSGFAPAGLHGSGYQWIQLGVMAFGDEIKMVANGLITPLHRKASKKYYEKYYAINYEIIQDEDGRSLRKIRFRRWEDVKVPIITGTLLLDNTTLLPVSFDGQLENMKFLLLVGEYSAHEEVKPKFHIDYRHDRGFTEVANLFARNSMSKMDERYTMVNVGDLDLPKGVQINNNNLWTAIDSAGLDYEFWRQHETVLRTADEKALFSLAHNGQQATFGLESFLPNGQNQQIQQKRLDERRRRDSIAASRLRGILLYDKEQRHPIYFADVEVVGKRRTMTNLNGFFLTDVWTDDTLLITANGYEPLLLPATQLTRYVQMKALPVEEQNPKDIKIDEVLSRLGTKLLTERQAHAHEQSRFFYRRFRKIGQDTLMTEAFLEAASELQITQPRVLLGRNILALHGDSLQNEDSEMITRERRDTALMELYGIKGTQDISAQKEQERETSLRLFDKMVGKRGDFKNPFVPLLGTGRTRHYRRHYQLSCETLRSTDGHRLLRIRFDKKHNWRYPVITGEMIVDLDSLQLLSFDGRLDGKFSVLSSTRKGRTDYIKTRPDIAIHYDFRHDRGFTEVWHAGLNSTARNNYDVRRRVISAEWYILMNVSNLPTDDSNGLQNTIVRTYEEEQTANHSTMPIDELLPPLITFDLFSEEANWRLLM